MLYKNKQQQTKTTNMPTFSSKDILVQGDIAAAITRSVLDGALGNKPSMERAVTATGISVLARILSKSFPDSLGNMNGSITNPETANMFIVGVTSALVAWGMKKNIAREVALSVVSDAGADKLLVSLDFQPNKSIFGSNKDDTDQTTTTTPTPGAGKSG
jgi:hypothetical protein